MKLFIIFILLFLLGTFAKTAFAKKNLPECKIQNYENETPKVLSKTLCYGSIMLYKGFSGSREIKITYEGDFNHGVQNGFGIYKHNNKVIYIGNWKNGKKHGSGKYTFNNGSKYSGNWKDDKMHGYGILKFNKGGVEFHIGYVYHLGDKYIGNFKDNQLITYVDNAYLSYDKFTIIKSL